MADPLTLLTDQQVQRFIVDGYVILQADGMPGLHDRIRSTIEEVYETEGNIGNNILPRIPDISRVFEHPNVAGALTSLLGPDYVLNPHRHGHLNTPGSAGQKWHKDCYVFDHNIRHPRFDWILAFYYPQDTTEEMGPSGILPGTQFQRSISDPDASQTTESPLPVCGPAGTVALIHFDAWHRATQNTSHRNRYMLKFQFARTREPLSDPPWDHRSARWFPDIDDAHPSVSRNVWNWLLCENPDGPNDPESLVNLLHRLEAEDETDRLDAAYRLASHGAGAIDPLIDAMRVETLALIEETTSTPADNRHGTNPTAGCASQALTAIGPGAITKLEKVMLEDENWWVRAVATHTVSRMGTSALPAAAALRRSAMDDHWWVRRNAVEGLGRLSNPSHETSETFCRALADDDYRVRRAGALAAARNGHTAAATVPHLAPLLQDENRYNRFYGEFALRRIGTVEANDLLLNALFTSRWCPITTKDDRY